MKLTKQRILEIIKEEVGAAQQDDSNTKQKLRKDFINVAKQFLPDADMVASEIELTSSLMTKILKKAGESGTSVTQLRRLNDIATKLLKEDILDETSQMKSIKNSLRTILRKLISSKPDDYIKITEDFYNNLTNDNVDQVNDYLQQIGEQPQEPQYLNNIRLALEDIGPNSLLDTAKIVADRAKQSSDSEEQPTEEPTDQPAEQPEADEQGVVVLPSSRDTVVPQQFDELVVAFKKFSDDDDGFMMKQYLKDQDALLLNLRSAMRKFIGEEGIERSLTEQEEPEPTAEPEDKTKSSRQSLVKYVTRYRRDINDTSKVMAEYLKAAQAGLIKAQPILNKLKLQLQKLQDDNVLIVRDLKALAGLSESLLAEEETRDEKIANVRKAYDKIVADLRPFLNVNVDAELQANEEELQSYVNSVKDALGEIDSIKKYFRLAGTFNRPLEEVKDDFVEYIQDYKNTMSDLISDLRTGVPNPDRSQQYANKFAELAKQIQEDFGVSPKQPIETPEVTVSPADADDTTQAISDESPLDQGGRDALDQADAAMQSQVTDFEIEDDEEEQPEPEADTGPRPDDITDINMLTDFLFDSNSDYFSPSVMTTIFGREYADAFKGIRRMLLALLYNKILQDRDEVPIADDTLQEKQREETDRQRLTRFGTRFGYDTGVITKFLDSIKGRNYLSQGREGPEFTSYNDLLNAITTLNNTKLEVVFSKLKQAEDDLKKADVGFSVSNSKIKQKIQSLLSVKGGKGKFTESKKHNNLLEKLIKQELKVLNGKKMVRN